MLDWSRCPAVERVPGKVSGNWLFKGTRVPVRALFENIESGARIDDFLDRQFLRAACREAADVRVHVEVEQVGQGRLALHVPSRIERGEVAELLADGHPPDERRSIRHHADARELIVLQTARRHAEGASLAAGRQLQADDVPEQGGLAAGVTADESDDRGPAERE